METKNCATVFMRGKFDMYFMKSIISQPPGEQHKGQASQYPFMIKYVHAKRIQ